MNRNPALHRLLVAATLAISLLLSWQAPAQGVIIARGVIAAPIGTPIWKPVDFHMFAAPIGTAESGYVEFGETMAALLPPPFHVANPSLGIGPGIPHMPPYDHELANGVARNRYHEGLVFAEREYTNGSGIYVVWMNVPAPGTRGSSPDYAQGRIIPNALFPIHVRSTERLNGKAYSFVADFDVPALDDSLTPPFDVDGHSHFPVFLASNADFGLPGVRPQGVHEFRTTMLDTLGNGWRIEAVFTVTH